MSRSHTALARKYRPRKFAEVAVQEHVSHTLRRAVATGRVGHAYLFCGPRGVGKTTLARVLAMSLNCAARQEDGEPCGTCDNCRRIWSGTTALDVVEIDAASNRGVDDARELRERAMYAPSEEGRSKVYIVDEAHMLTREAWNALLKILEEPPPRVIFIFATTEPQKIEQTAAPILSRCQRFDFRRVGVVDIIARLGEVLEAESAEASDEALRLIARKADGGMRDALSILDQVLALSEGGVTAETVRDVLGVVGEDRYLQLFDVLVERDQAGLFVLIQTLLDEGYDLVEFYHGLMDHLRSLLRLRVSGASDELPAESLAAWRKRAEAFAPADLVRMLGMAAELETQGSLRRTQQPRVLLELLLLRFTYLDRTLELESLLHALGGEGSAAGLGIAADTGSGTPQGGGGRGGGAVDGADGGGRSERDGGSSTARGPESRMSAGSSRTDVSGASAAPAADTDPPAAPRPDTGSPSTSTSEAPSSGTPVSERARPAPSEPDGAPPPDRTPAGIEDPAEAWAALLKDGDAVPRGMLTLLRGVHHRTVDRATLSLTVIPGPVLERLSQSDELATLERALSRYASGPVSIELHVPDDSDASAARRISQDEAKEGRLRDLLAKEPGLRPAVEELDLELLD